MSSLARLAPLALCGLVWLSPVQAQLVARFQADRTGAGAAALSLARQALDAHCLHRTRLSVPIGLPPLLYMRSAVFVSAQHDGAPRCCMGSLRPRGASLAGDIISAAVAAAAHDERFPPLRPEELPGLRVIVSILDPARQVSDPSALDPLLDGLAVRGPQRTGVVLPGETTSPERFLSWARIRAGAGAEDTVTYHRLRAIRFIEKTPTSAHGGSPCPDA